MQRPRDDVVLSRVDEAGEVVLRHELQAFGIPRSAYHRLLARGDLRRVAGSAFVTARRWEQADRWTRFRLQSLGVGRTAPTGVHLTGWAAAVLHGLPVLGAPPQVPVGVIPGDPHRAPRRTPYFRFRHGWLPEHRQVEKAGLHLADEVYTAVDVARHVGRQAGLVVADGVLTRGGSADDLAAVCENMRHYPGIKDARWCADHASDRSESPVESLGRWAFLHAGRPAPLANVWFWQGRRRFRADLYLPDQKVILEADGAVKYNNRPDAAQVVREQVEREEFLRSWNLGLVRFTHADPIKDPFELVRRADRAALLRPDGPLLCQWSLEPPWAV